jgi:hypothetical protein
VLVREETAVARHRRSHRVAAIAFAVVVAAGTILTLAPPASAAVAISIVQPDVFEGDSGTTPMNFAVTVTGCSTATCSGETLTYSTLNGFAVGGEDFTAISNAQYAFQASDCNGAGTCSKNLAVSVIGDTKDELNEHMQLRVTTHNGFIQEDAFGLIRNDDAPALSVSSPTVTEPANGTTQMNFVVRAVGCFQFECQDDTINVKTSSSDATINNDYVPINSDRFWADGQCTNTQPISCELVVPVTVLADNVNEGDEHVTLTVTHKGNGDQASGTGTIHNHLLTCQNTNGQFEKGPVSGVVHRVDSALPDPLGQAVHNLNCDVIVANGL